jgi:DNA-binding XRE family transcriptional regulator
MSAAARWDTGDYQRIVGVERHGDEVAVHFGDGTEVVVDVERLLPSGVHGVDWEALSSNPYEIVVPTSVEQVEIPWSAIRVLTDRDYATHLAHAAKEQARQIGLRIKELREQRGLTGKDLAERAGITPQSLSRIENGHHDVVYATLQQILAAMGASLKDLVVSPSRSPRAPRKRNDTASPARSNNATEGGDDGADLG